MAVTESRSQVVIPRTEGEVKFKLPGVGSSHSTGHVRGKHNRRGVAGRPAKGLCDGNGFSAAVQGLGRPIPPIAAAPDAEKLNAMATDYDGGKLLTQVLT